MLDAGAHEGSLLFRGVSNNGRYEGIAYLFDRRCGPVPYRVSGPILDDEERIALMGMAPRLGRNCRIQGSFEDRLEFNLLKPLEVTSPQVQPSTNPNLSASGPPSSESMLSPNQKVPDRSKDARSPNNSSNVAPAVQPAPQVTPKSGNQKNVEFLALFWLVAMGCLLAGLTPWLIFKVYKAVRNA